MTRVFALLGLATSALDLGAVTFLWWGIRERDLVLDLFEMSSGQRLHTRYFQIGGVAEVMNMHESTVSGVTKEK